MQQGTYGKDRQFHNRSQSPYGEASLATKSLGKHSPTLHKPQSQSPYGEASLATHPYRPGGQAQGAQVAIPLRGSISCNPDKQAFLEDDMAWSQSPYGEASLATCRLGEHELLGWVEGRNPLTGKHLLQLGFTKAIAHYAGQWSQSPYGEASLATVKWSEGF